ncbi:hypothetical protein [Mycolicibacterium sarraceniae]|uniref:Uncharacterized protein n=1 Tax=Mycolicibacterium sarraceniae TaxID=1534348 RepID=A0A7I7SP03_9MYCO|nr:hypothetical protein [Mycolicibacterium sarraceniae]BBY58518.1 hypothetical protein MSAR_16540 [Mycolicibacterium sarraceniae]
MVTAAAPGTRSTESVASCELGYRCSALAEKPNWKPSSLTRNHLAVELCWGFYQRMIAAYAHPDRRHGKTALRS